MRWEYKIVRGIQPGCDEKVLADAGAEGWELVQVLNQSLYFKRVATTELQMFEAITELADAETGERFKIRQVSDTEHP